MPRKVKLLRSVRIGVIYLKVEEGELAEALELPAKCLVLFQMCLYSDLRFCRVRIYMLFIFIEKLRAR